jgi:chromosome segregation ATPase
VSFFVIWYILSLMFGITPTPQPQSNTHGRITQNSREELRRGASSSTYDNAAAERMKMEYLKKERERRERERNKLVYDGKKRDLDRYLQDEERMKIESRRLEAELAKYNHDVESIKLQEKREISGIPALKKEELELAQKIQKTESELLMYKNRHQKVQQDIAKIDQTDKSMTVDIHKREVYVDGIKAKFDIVKRNHAEIEKNIAKLKPEVDQLKRLIG